MSRSHAELAGILGNPEEVDGALTRAAAHLGEVTLVHAHVLLDSTEAQRLAVKNTLVLAAEPSYALASWIFAEDHIEDPEELSSVRVAIIDNLLGAMEPVEGEPLVDPAIADDMSVRFKVALAFLDTPELKAGAAELRSKRLLEMATRAGTETTMADYFRKNQYWRPLQDGQQAILRQQAVAIGFGHFERRIASDHTTGRALYYEAYEYAKQAKEAGDVDVTDRACRYAVDQITCDQKGTIDDRIPKILILSKRPDIVASAIDKALGSFDRGKYQVLMRSISILEDDRANDERRLAKAKADLKADTEQLPNPHIDPPRTKRAKARLVRHFDKAFADASERHHVQQYSDNHRAKIEQIHDQQGRLDGQIGHANAILRLAASNVVALATAEGGLDVLESAVDLDRLVALKSDTNKFSRRVRSGYDSFVESWEIQQAGGTIDAETLKHVFDVLKPFFPSEEPQE